MKTVHMIFNAHLDPIWLWPWQAGVDEALATCRSACDRLDAHPDVTFARGEAWVYQQVEKLDPPLFERIRAHVKTGRWEIVGGWCIQPDCNLPSGFAWKKQIELGKEYFLDRFGIFPRIAYNVDSFGHAASLPALMRSCGQDRYIMMRPQEHEMALPGRVFRWRGHEGSQEVTVFRIARGYCTGNQLSLDHVRAALNDLPNGIDHTMCFVGLGDHGGGPTERMIASIREHQNAIDGAKLVFSTPARFFDAIAKQTKSLPLVTGELQMHAVGCYSVHRPVKVLVRRAEHMLHQAEIAIEKGPNAESGTIDRLKDAWRTVCFHQFHDTFGGTCIPSAYEQVHAQLQGAWAVGDEVLQYALRRRLPALPDDPKQRVVLLNASDEAFDGYTMVEPWMGWQRWQEQTRLVDERGRVVPTQIMHSEAIAGGLTRLLLRVKAAPGEMRVLRIEHGATRASGTHAKAKIQVTGDGLASGTGLMLRLGSTGGMDLASNLSLPLPQLHLLEDPSDTWSHGYDRYTEGPAVSPLWNAPVVVDNGPLMASMVQTGTIGGSSLMADYRLYAGEPFVQMILRVHWAERHKILKLVLPLPIPLGRRWDGIPGDELERQPDGRERPLRDRTLLELQGNKRLGIVCPDVFALDALPHRVRLTLLRSSIMAHHEPSPGTWPRGVVSDQGVHEFRFLFGAGPRMTGRQLDQQALMTQRPLAFADLTRGMPPRG